MWKKLVFALVTLVPSLGLLAVGLVLAWVCSRTPMHGNVSGMPGWLSFLNGCGDFGMFVGAIFFLACGLAATLATGGVFLESLWKWANAGEKS
jgi:fucose permease